MMNGPMGRVVVRKSIPIEQEDDDDDHDKDGIPPEIVELIKMTEAMHRRSAGGVGGISLAAPRQLRPNQKEENDNTPRHEESHDEIMAKMNKLSEEIGERHDREKLNRIGGKKSQRFTQVLAALGGVLLLMLISFVLTCQAKKGRDSEAEEDEPSTGGNKRVGAHTD